MMPHKIQPMIGSSNTKRAPIQHERGLCLPKVASVPRPGPKPQSAAPTANQSAPPIRAPLRRPASALVAPSPPPLPVRAAPSPVRSAPLAAAVAVPRSAPPPLPVRPLELLADSDLVDDDVSLKAAAAARAEQPTTLDVELDIACFTRTEPPPSATGMRRGAFFGLASLLLAAAAGVCLLSRPVEMKKVLGSSSSEVPGAVSTGAASSGKKVTPAPSADSHSNAPPKRLPAAATVQKGHPKPRRTLRTPSHKSREAVTRNQF